MRSASTRTGSEACVCRLLIGVLTLAALVGCGQGSGFSTPQSVGGLGIVDIAIKCETMPYACLVKVGPWEPPGDGLKKAVTNLPCNGISKQSGAVFPKLVRDVVDGHLWRGRLTIPSATYAYGTSCIFRNGEVSGGDQFSLAAGESKEVF